MTEIEIISQIANLPINAILIGAVAVLWRKIGLLEKKYENAITELAHLKGQAEVRKEIKDDLKDIKKFIISKT